MALNFIDLYLDVSDPFKVYRDLNGTTALPINFFQGSKVAMHVYLVRPNGSLTGARFSKIDITGMTLKCYVGRRAGAESLQAYQETWTLQTTADSAGQSGYFYATLSLATTELDTAIGSSDTYSTYLEFRLTESGDTRVACQVSFTLLSIVKDPSSSVSLPSAAANYFTAEQCMDMFVMWNNAARAANNGRLVTLVSQDGTNTRALGVDNEGGAIDNLT